MTNLISFLQMIGLKPKNTTNIKRLSTGVQVSVTNKSRNIEQIEVYSPIELDERGNPIEKHKSPCFKPFVSETQIN